MGEHSTSGHPETSSLQLGSMSPMSTPSTASLPSSARGGHLPLPRQTSVEGLGPGSKSRTLTVASGCRLTFAGFRSQWDDALLVRRVEHLCDLMGDALRSTASKGQAREWQHPNPARHVLGSNVEICAVTYAAVSLGSGVASVLCSPVVPRQSSREKAVRPRRALQTRLPELRSAPSCWEMGTSFA